MPEIVTVAVSDLLLDPQNARLTEEQGSQQETALALARQQNRKLINLADDIVNKGLDPTVLPAIIPTDDARKRYRVLEGNRRVLALKALDAPGLIAPALDSRETTRLNKLAERFATAPVDEIKCVLFSNEQEAIHWVRLRHTGDNEGVGIAQWGSAEKVRFDARHGDRSPVLQVLDFVNAHGSLSDDAKQSKARIITSLKRLISTPAVRDRVGIDIVEGVVYSRFPSEEVAKGLSRVVEDLLTKKVTVPDIYHVDQRELYVDSLGTSDLPIRSTEVSEAIRLDDLTQGTPPKTKPSAPRRRKRRVKIRTSLIPRDCILDIDPPRINAIYNELQLDLSLEKTPNAVAVLLRVFVELSVDHYIEEAPVAGTSERKPLADKIIAAAGHLKAKGQIDDKMHRAIKSAASSSTVLSATTTTFNQYVHNYYAHPSPADLRSQWDDLQPFIEAIWAKP